MSQVSEDEQSVDGGLESMKEELNQIDSAFDLEQAIMGILQFTGELSEDEDPPGPAGKARGDKRASSISALRDLLIGADPTHSHDPTHPPEPTRRHASITATDLLRSLQQSTHTLPPTSPPSPNPSTSPRARLRPPDPGEGQDNDDDDEHDVFAKSSPGRMTQPRPPPLLHARSASHGSKEGGGSSRGGHILSPNSAAVQRQLDKQIGDVLVRAKKVGPQRGTHRSTAF